MAAQHVLINGAGLAGLSLAIALAKRNIRSTLFEIRNIQSTLSEIRAVKRTICGTIVLAPNALRVLDQTMGVYDQIRKVGFEYEHIEFYSEGDWRFGGRVNGDRKAYGYPALRINLPTIVEALLKYTNSYPGLITIRWSDSINKITARTAGVEVRLQNGSTISGNIVVGADGIHSKIREHVLGDRAPTPTYSGHYSILGTVERDEIDWQHFKLPASLDFHRGTLLLFPFTSDARKIAWAIQHTVPEKSREDWLEYLNSGAALADVRKQFAGAKQPVKDILAKTKVETMRGWPPYMIPDIPTWHTDRVLLIGDAARCIPPCSGQGAAQAFEDAGYLARLLDDETTLKYGYSAIFAHFEKVRKKRFSHVRELTARSGKTREHSNKLQWIMNKYLMWFYSSRNEGGYLRDDSICGYDVNKEPPLADEHAKKITA